MQFIVAANWIHRHYRKAELTAIGNWIGWSFSPVIDGSHEVSVELDRIDFFTKHPWFAAWPQLQSYLVMYLSGFYYYVRARTAMKNIAEGFWGNAEMVFTRVLSMPEEMQQLDALLGTSMLEWASKESPERARGFTALIERAAEMESIPGEARYLFSVSLSTNGGRFSSTCKEEWAAKALSEFKAELPQHLEVQLRSILADPSDPPSVEQLFAVLRHVQSQHATGLEGVQFARACGRNFDSLAPYFRRLIDAGDVAALTDLLWAWYRPLDNAKDKIEPAGLLITIPALDTGLSFLTMGRNERVDRDSQSLLERMVALDNQFLGIAKTVAYADNSRLELPARPGVPEVTTVGGLENSLVDYYCPAKPECSGVNSQLVFPAEGRPVQAAQLIAWGKTWPIAASMSDPRPDSTLHRAVVWLGAGTLTEEMEAEAIAVLLRRAGVQVERIDAREATADNFVQVYDRGDIDLIWVISHGHFDHWSPHAVRLQVSHSGAAVELETLWSRVPDRETRRLLVLNVCDGGRFEELGPVPHVGMAAGLADCAQATISHLWPVMPFSSAAFGACLALGLSRRLPFFHAYVQAIAQLRGGPQKIAQALDDACGERLELSRALTNRTDDMGSLEIWGSAVFYQ